MKLYFCTFWPWGYIVEDSDGAFWRVKPKPKPLTGWSWDGRKPMPARWRDGLKLYDDKDPWPVWTTALGIPSE